MEEINQIQLAEFLKFTRDNSVVDYKFDTAYDAIKTYIQSRNIETEEYLASILNSEIIIVRFSAYCCLKIHQSFLSQHSREKLNEFCRNPSGNNLEIIQMAKKCFGI